MTPALRALVDRALVAYPFRPRGPWEGERQFLDALIEHVMDRDFSMAYELRFGRVQAEWSDDEIATFRRFMFDNHRAPREDVRGPVHVFDAGRHAVSDASLDALAHEGLRLYVERKREQPSITPPLLAHVLLTDGRLRVAWVDRGDRVAVLMQMARELPVFGFFVLCDVFIHGVPPEGAAGPAAKREALICHLGTRDRRVMICRPYAVIDGRAVFDDPPPADLDKRGPETKSDPYAGVFAAPLHRTRQ